jgi:peptide chain release factor 2
LQQQSESSELWDNPEAARIQMQKVATLQRYIQPWDDLENALHDLQTLAELAIEEDEPNLEAEIDEGLKTALAQLENMKVELLFHDKYDDNSAILSVNAGAGGTEACDWAAMLLRMYQRYAEARGWDFTVVSSVDGEAAGIRNATATVQGFRAYGRLKAEAGVHRLVRISPFDSSKRRHTSFASVDVIPEIEHDGAEVEVPPEELRVDTFHASGAGGQHVNKTDSAVRITHLPTAVVVQCQSERSQHANRRTAMQLLMSRLHEIERRKQQQELDTLRGEQRDIDFGSQIRSYVLQPYTLVKDHRTGVEASQVQTVLNGDIDRFIVPYLQMKAAEGDQDDV